MSNKYICWHRWTTQCCLKPNRTYCTAHSERAGHREYSTGNKICRYWKPIATQTYRCRLL